MNRFLLSLSVLLLISVNGVSGAAAQEAPEDSASPTELKAPAVEEPSEVSKADTPEASIVPDNRAASFMPPPVDLLSRKDAEATEEKAQETEAPLKETPEEAPVAKEETKEEPPETLSKVEIAVPVAKENLGHVDPETIGLLTQENGGFAPSLWQGVARAFLEQSLPALALPTASPTLNDLMQRALLTSAAVPEKKEEDKKQSLLSMRIEKLLNLGLAREAWTLVQKAEPSLIDSLTLRRAAEAALTTDLREDVCKVIPSYLGDGKASKDKASLEWEKALLVCHVLKGEVQAVQLGIDVLHEQGVEDDTFLLLLTRNYMASSKSLPRRLTPLNPLTLSIMAKLDGPLPSEIYGHPEASLVPLVLKTKAKKEDLRLGLAEKEAARGVISALTLSQAYKSLDVSKYGDSQKPVLVHAQYFQEASGQVNQRERVTAILKLVHTLPARALTGAAGMLAASMVADVSPTSDYNTDAADMARLMALTGQVQKASLWYQLARDAGHTDPKLAPTLQRYWPVFALSRVIPEEALQDTAEKWLRVFLKEGKKEDLRERKELAGKILLLLSSSNLNLADTMWDKVFEPLPARRDLVASPVLVERLLQAAKEKRQGEVILLAALVCPDGAAKSDYASLLAVTRALREVGLETESLSFAREALASMLER